MRILGIDPGSTATGYGVIERGEGKLLHVAHGTLRPPRGLPLAVRLDHLYCMLAEVLEGHEPDCVVVETVFVAVSPQSALVLGQARGVILAAIAAAGLPISEYAPARIKRSVTGNGRATKQQVKSMVKRLLALDRLPSADAADALAAAISHAHAGRLESLYQATHAGGRSAARRVAFTARRPR